MLMIDNLVTGENNNIYGLHYRGPILPTRVNFNPNTQSHAG